MREQHATETCHHGPDPGAPRAERGYCLICTLKRGFLKHLAECDRSHPARFERGEPNEEGIRAMAELIVQGLVRDEIDDRGRVVFVITRAGAEATR